MVRYTHQPCFDALSNRGLVGGRRNARRGRTYEYRKLKAFFFAYFLLSPNKRKYEYVVALYYK
ncbi:MAG: hypothetical protein WBK20_02825 [Spirochaetota bacterium]